MKISHLLRDNGKLILTVPFGKKYRDHFLKSFTWEEIKSLFINTNLDLINENYYKRNQFKYWHNCSRDEARGVSNARSYRGPTGVNCVGCFILQKTKSSRF